MPTPDKVVTKPVKKRAGRRAPIAAATDVRRERVHEERVRVDDAPPPAPGHGEIVVRRQTCVVNSVHLALITGAAGALPSDGAAHLEAVGAAGTVIAVADGVTRFAVGDEVFGRLQAPAGTWPPYVSTDAEGPHVELRPDALEPAAAAALVESGLTAKTIVRAAGVRSGQTALVIGAAGGVGTLLVPLLADAGVSVVATTDPGDDEHVRSLGAAETIHDSAGDASEALARYPDVDLVVDLVNFGEPYFTTARAVRSSGWIVGTLPVEEADAPQGLGLPRIEPRAEPGDLVELARRALDGRGRIETPGGGGIAVAA